MKKTLALILLLAGLTLDAQGENRIRIWSPQVDYIWKHGGSNWSNLVGKRDEYRDGDPVMFGSLPNGTVELMGTLTPASVLVDNDRGSDYIFSGDGSLDGNMQLTKTGSRTLTIYNSNTYEGGTKIEGGKIVIGHDHALGYGAVTMSGGTLDLGDHTFANIVTIAGSASIGNGKLNGNLSVKAGKTLKLSGYLDGSGIISLADNATLNLNGHTLSNDVSLTGDSASIGNGIIGGNLILAENASFAWRDSTLQLEGNVILGNQAALDLDNHNISNNVIVDGSNATISNGKISGNVTVAEGKSLFLKNGVVIKEAITLNDTSELDLGNNTLSNSVTLAGNSAGIGNGTLNGDLSVNANNTLTLLGDLSGEGSISLGENATLDLGKHSLTKGVTLARSSANIGNGKLDVSLSVDNGNSLALMGDLSGTGTISLGYDTTLYLNNNTLDGSVTLTGSAGIGGGTFNGSLEVGADNTLSLLGELYGKGKISLGNNAVLELSGSTLSNSVSLAGDSAQIGGGTFNGSLEVGANKKLTLSGYLGGEGKISLGDNATLDLDDQPLSGNVTLTGSNATISNGTVNGTLTAKQGASARLSGATIEAGATNVKSLDGAKPGLLQEISVSDGLIAGIDRQTSLADGLEIESTANLMIKSMTITADNKISVGNNTITLQDVTIKLSQTTYELVEGIYYFNLSDLFHCSVDMVDVVFDASDLSLPEGFNPETNGISFNLGDAKLTAETADGDISLLMGGYGSQTMSIDEQGRPVFSKLVETPEPATGTLSLMALAGLCARRRRRK